MSKETTFKISEVFMSLEGEALYQGHPTVYIRNALCNFSCPHFNNPNKEVNAKGYAPLTFNPKEYTSILDMPMISMGCDSQYAVNPEFSHVWKQLTTDELITELEAILPNNQWQYASGKKVICSITGGEPTMQWKAIVQLLQHPRFQPCDHIIYETNAAVPLNLDFIVAINQWLDDNPNRKWTWSNSPKLSSSGEKWEKAIRPEIVRKQHVVSGKYNNQVDQYFKFVAGFDENDYAEIAKAMNEYYAAETPRTASVYVMPMSCTLEQQNEVARFVADKCMNLGYVLCYRVHSAVWGNVVGT